MDNLVNSHLLGAEALTETKQFIAVSIPSDSLKEYSVILTTSFYGMNQKILRKKAYFQNFS